MPKFQPQNWNFLTLFLHKILFESTWDQISSPLILQRATKTIEYQLLEKVEQSAKLETKEHCARPCLRMQHTNKRVSLLLKKFPQTIRGVYIFTKARRGWKTFRQIQNFRQKRIARGCLKVKS